LDAQDSQLRHVRMSCADQNGYGKLAQRLLKPPGQREPTKGRVLRAHWPRTWCSRRMCVCHFTFAQQLRTLHRPIMYKFPTHVSTRLSKYITHDPQTFVLQIRDEETHQTLQGIAVADMGPSEVMAMQLRPDNGYMLFDHFRAPITCRM